MNDDSLLVPALNVLGAVATVLLWGFPSIFVHELGHAVAAKLLGLRPTHLIIGAFESMFSFRLFGIRVIFRLAPIGGVTLVDAMPTSKLQAFIFVASGPSFNAVIVLLAIAFWQHSSLKMILAAVIISEIGQLIYDLIPGSTVYEGTKIPRDGKLLIQIFKRSAKRTEGRAGSNLQGVLPK